MAILQFRRGNTPSSPSELGSGELYLDLTQDKFLYKNVGGDKLYSISRSNVVNNLTQLNNISSLLLETGDIGVTTDDQRVYMRSGSNWYPLMYERLLNSEDISNNAITGDKILTGSISYENLNDDLKFTVDNINNNLKYGLDFDGNTEYLTRPIQIISKTDWRTLSNFNSILNVTGSNSNISNDLSRPYVVPLSSSLFNSNGYIGVTGSAGLIVGKRYMGRITYYNDNATDFRIGSTNSSSAYKLLDKKSKNWQESEFNFIATSTDIYVKLNGTGTGYVQELRIKEDTGLDLNDSEMIDNRISRKFTTSGVFNYQSDFSSGLSNFTAVRSVATGNNDGVSDGSISYDNVLKYYANNETDTHYINLPNANTNLRLNKSYRIKFWYLIPSTNTNVKRLISTNGISTIFGSSDGTVLDMWTEYSADVVVTIDLTNIRLYLGTSFSLTFTGSNSPTDDLVYIYDYRIEEIPQEQSNGNHAFSIDSITAFNASGVTNKSKCGKIISSGTGDSDSNNISLPATSFNVLGSTDSRTKVLSGFKYLITFLAKAATNNTTINVNIGSKTGTALTLADNTKWYLYTYQFLATSSEVDAQLKIFLNQADTVYIDELSISKAYDMLINIWDRNVMGLSNLNIICFGALGSLNSNGYRIYRPMPNDLLYFRIQGYEYTTANPTYSNSLIISNNKSIILQFLLRTGNIKRYENDTSLSDYTTIFSYINNYSSNLFFGALSTLSEKYLGLIGQIQFVRFNNADSFNPLDIDGAGTSIYEYSQTHKGYPNSYTGGEIVFWFDWVGDTDTEMLTDLSGRGNNLTGVNVTLLDDRRRYILE